MASIREFGFTNPILVDPEVIIIAGHGRLRAARELGLGDLPTIVLRGLSESQKRALRPADNKIALGAGWDLDILRTELADLSELSLDLDLSLTGFSTGEIAVILKSAAGPDDEVIPAVPKAPKTRTGDIWILGEHRIGCGDGRDPAFLRRIVGDGRTVDSAFLDPPYNVRINGHANARGRHREFAMTSGEMSDAAFRTFLAESLAACASISRDGAVHFVCMDRRHMDDVSVVAKDVYGARLNLCIWNKSNAGMGSLYRSKHELVFVYRVGKPFSESPNTPMAGFPTLAISTISANALVFGTRRWNNGRPKPSSPSHNPFLSISRISPTRDRPQFSLASVSGASG